MIREEFGLTWNAALETGGVLVGKEVIIKVELELYQSNSVSSNHSSKKKQSLVENKHLEQNTQQ